MDAAYPILSGALVQEKRLEVIANNLANLNTTGYKRDRTVFEIADATLGIAQASGSGSVEPTPVFSGLSLVATDFAPGAVRATGDPLDVAIDGEGFFVVETPAGPRYTRNGHFTLDAEGRIVTPGGHPVLGTGGAIALPLGQVGIGPDGRIAVDGTEVDTLRVVRPADLARLNKAGDNLFDGGDQAPLDIPARLRPGALESSNVNPVEEMTAMIEVLRLYEAAQKVMQSADAAMGKAVNEVGVVR